MKQPLTPKQRTVYEFIASTIERRGSPPSQKEIADDFGFRSTATAHEYVDHLVRKGWLVRTEGQHYGVALPPPPPRVSVAALEEAWNLLAEVDWNCQSVAWCEAAHRWRRRYLDGGDGNG